MENVMKKIYLSFLLVLLPLFVSADPVEIDGICYIFNLSSKVAEVTQNPFIYTGNVVIPKTITYEGVSYEVTSIGTRAFYNCKNLTSVTIPSSVEIIRSDAFSDCAKLNSVHITDIEAWIKIIFVSNPLVLAHHLFLNGEEIKDLIIPSSVTSIGDNTFIGCSLTSVTIPNSVTSIGENAFKNCSSLTSVIIPNSVSSIGNTAFSGCSSLTSVTIPNSLNSIFAETFSGCSSLTSVIIPNSVTSIGGSAFSGCSQMSTVTIGDGIESIYPSAFSKCPELKDVYCYAEKVPKISSDAFEESNIEYATLHVPSSSIDAYKTVAPWSSFKNIVAIDATDIKSLEGTATAPSDVYDQSGRKVLTNVTSLEGLPNGIYIVKGKKILKK